MKLYAMGPIHVEAGTGTIHNAAAAAIVLAQKLSCMVMLHFNERIMEVNETDEPNTIVANYFRQIREAK